MMRLALVFDAPRTSGPFAGVTGAYLTRLLEACSSAAGVDADYKPFFAVTEQQPGGKAPPIALIRKSSEQLFDGLLRWQPDAVLSFGTGALNALSDSVHAIAISKERGRMRWLSAGSSSTDNIVREMRVPWVPTISPGLVIRSPDLHRDIANDVFKVMTQIGPLPAMDIELHVPENTKDLQIALKLLEGASVVGVDVETTGLSPHNDDLLAVGIGAIYHNDHGIAVVVKQSLIEQSADILWDAVWRSSRRSVGHNYKFDMQFLAPLISWAPDGALIGDTLLLSHLLDERPNRPTSRVRGLGLKDQVATRYDLQYGFDFGEFYALPDDEKDWDAMHVYLGQDVCYTARLWHDLVTEANEESPRLLECHDQLLMPVSKQIARCEWAGAPIDVPWIEQTVQNLGRRIERRRTALEQMIGLLAPETKVDNVMSAQQVANAML